MTRDRDLVRPPKGQRETGVEPHLHHLAPRRDYPPLPRKLKTTRSAMMRRKSSCPEAACTLPCGRLATRPAGRPGCSTSAAGTRNTSAAIGRCWRCRKTRTGLASFATGVCGGGERRRDMMEPGIRSDQIELSLPSPHASTCGWVCQNVCREEGISDKYSADQIRSV